MTSFSCVKSHQQVVTDGRLTPEEVNDNRLQIERYFDEDAEYRRSCNRKIYRVLFRGCYIRDTNHHSFQHNEEITYLYSDEYKVGKNSNKRVREF